MEADRNSTIISEEEIDNFGKVHYNQTGHLTFYTMRH